ncbi:hypothetical protein SAMN05443572_105166 [Myxococcus fulvus]|uniref:Uncharacterized protein n=2 Tax=Myxococcus fulvus TaxID=33 RepID=A0A511TDI3_MYXFU|nr:hypothetical protein MFU01_65090 [Myxococcus fulvus]SEU13074.1 hypothetical protein SAMN05443572_105166 [Myxococcus fulvus]
MFLEGTDGREQAEALLRLTVESMATTGDGPGRLPVVFRIWPGPVFELTCPWQVAQSEFLSRPGSPLAFIDTRMLTLPVGGPSTWALILAPGVILNALSSRVLLQTSSGASRRESFYSRGGLISPLRDSTTGPSNGSRVVFELDPLFFDEAARAHVHSDEVLDALAARFSWLTIAQRASDVRAGDPW